MCSRYLTPKIIGRPVLWWVRSLQISGFRWHRTLVTLTWTRQHCQSKHIKCCFGLRVIAISSTTILLQNLSPPLLLQQQHLPCALLSGVCRSQPPVCILSVDLWGGPRQVSQRTAPGGSQGPSVWGTRKLGVYTAEQDVREVVGIVRWRSPLWCFRHCVEVLRRPGKCLIPCKGLSLIRDAIMGGRGTPDYDCELPIVHF